MKQNNFELSPTLETKNLILRPLSIEDSQDIFHLRSNEEVNKYLGRQLCQNLEEAGKFINIILDSTDKAESYYWAITCRKSKIFFGTICLYNISNDKVIAEIGFELLPGYYGKGIMKEAADRVNGYAFDLIKIESIVACTHPKNKSSIQLLLKLGFVKSEETSKEYSETCGFILKKN